VTSSLPALDLVAMRRPYRWTPVRVKSFEGCEEDGETGTFVHSLSMDIAEDDAAWQPLLEAQPCPAATRDRPMCCLIEGTIVLCRGAAPAGNNLCIGRLPESMWPIRSIEFASLAQETYKAPLQQPVSCGRHLIKLVVTADGWVHCHSGRLTEGVCDLRGIRFGLARGISVMDEVRLQICHLRGRCLVILQGKMECRHFEECGAKPLALLPQACQPPTDRPFIVAGTRDGGFHLLCVRRTTTLGMGGEITWNDSIWHRDAINLSGIMYEAAPEATQFAAQLNAWTPVRKQIVIREFQKGVISKVGSLQKAWGEIFDTDGSGQINFTEFGRGCKSFGYNGNLTRLWDMLDDDGSGEISFNEFEMDVGEL